MTTSNTPDQRIDGILDDFGSCLVENLGIAGSDMALFTHLAKEGGAKARAALKSLMETMMAEVVGEDDNYGEGNLTDEDVELVNAVKWTQRQRIPQVINKYFNTEEK